MCNKFFLGLLLVILFYGREVLNNVTIFGVSHTAPFSAWSFGDYLSRMTPLLWIGTSFLVAFFTSRRSLRAAVLTDAASVSPRRYAAARCAAALTGSMVLALACIAEAAAFYSLNFGWHDWGELIVPAALTLPPSMLFALGSGWFLGQLKPWLTYVWMAAPFLCMSLPLPDALGIWNGSFFTDYPMTLNSLDPEFCLSAPVVAVQCVFAASGVVLAVFKKRI